MTDVIHRASALVEAGRNADAVALLKSELAGSPDDPELLDELAVAQLDLSSVDALETARKLIAVDPNGHRGHVIASIACNSLDEVSGAISHAEAAIAAAPYLPIGHALYATALSRKKGRRNAALKAAERAIELAPDDPVGYRAAGSVELHYGNWRRAQKRLETSLELDPMDRAAAMNLAVAREAGGNLSHAFADTRNLLSLDPRDADARDVLDGIAYTTLVHVAWVLLVLLWVSAVIKGV
jgi:tetratricopeptide (TPR) repeat protein